MSKKIKMEFLNLRKKFKNLQENKESIVGLETMSITHKYALVFKLLISIKTRER